MHRRIEDERARLQHVRQRVWIILRFRRDLREGDVTRRFDEGAELGIRHRRAVDPEIIDRDAVRRRLLRIVPVGAHAKRAAGDVDHPVRDPPRAMNATPSKIQSCYAVPRRDCRVLGEREWRKLLNSVA